jgi:hypothetical protein
MRKAFGLSHHTQFATILFGQDIHFQNIVSTNVNTRTFTLAFIAINNGDKYSCCVLVIFHEYQYSSFLFQMVERFLTAVRTLYATQPGTSMDIIGLSNPSKNRTGTGIELIACI